MDQESIIEILESNGFQGRKLEGSFKEECTVYEQENYDSLDIIINGVDLYVHKCNYVKFEVDKWGLCIRLYYDYNYVGCITNAWEDIKEFNIEVSG